jgi:ribosome biogenesis GTPase
MKKSHPKNHSSPLQKAHVIASYGRHFLAQDEQGTVWQIYGKGKRREVAVGDCVRILPSGDKQAWVEEIMERRNLLYRSDELKSKMFAANMDAVILVLAVSPPYSPELLGRTWVACKHADIPLHIVFNKADLLEEVDRAELQEALQEITLGNTPVHWLSATEAPEKAKQLLMPLLSNKRTLILGQSGMGKSTLINLLIPEALVATNDISLALNTGKHTTTHTQLHSGTNGMALIDSPGFQAFGLHHLDENDLLHVFDDIAEKGMRCRFANCKHIHEPDCAVKEALTDGSLSKTRFELFALLRAAVAR